MPPNQILWDDISRCNVPTNRVYTALETVEDFDHRFDFFLVHLHQRFHVISSSFLVNGVSLGSAMRTVSDWTLRRLSMGEELLYVDGFSSRASVARLEYGDAERTLLAKRVFDVILRADVHVSYSVEPLAE